MTEPLSTVIIADERGLVRRFGPSAQAFFHRREQDAVGRPVAELFEGGAGGASTATIPEGHLRSAGGDGSSIPVRVRLGDASSPSERLTAVIVDRLEGGGVPVPSDGLLRAMFDHAPYAMSVLEADGRNRITNRAASRIYGYDDLPRGGSSMDYIHPEDLDVLMDRLRSILEGELAEWGPNRYRVLTAHGWRWIETSGVDLRRHPEVRGLVVFSQDVTDDEEHRHGLREALAQLRAVIDGVSAGILVEDHDGNVVLANDALRRLFDLEADPVGRSGLDVEREIARSVREAEMFEASTATTRASIAPRSEEPIDLADGRRLERDHTPLYDGEAFLGHVWLYRDVTQRVHLLEQRRRLLELERRARITVEERNEELRSLDALRARMLSTVSHELRTPLTAILSFSELAADSATIEEARSSIEVVVRNATRLRGMVDDLLLANRLEAGAERLTIAPFEVPDQLAETLGELRLSAEEAGVTIELDAQPGPTLFGDVEKVRRIVSNLVVNAIKFSPRGSEIHVRATSGADAWAIAVSDEGPGLDAAEVSSIFEPFYRTASTERSGVHGAGLGLAIVKALVELHGGRIGVTSDPSGTTFEVVLPDRDGSPGGGA